MLLAAFPVVMNSTSNPRDSKGSEFVLIDILMAGHVSNVHGRIPSPTSSCLLGSSLLFAVRTVYSEKARPSLW
ncbi:hypothetical protein EYF80_020076 [Liparis tanakae]|uniref:Uncharacterized protein n=1 Tax=Liparis tanakae TaxID=230148 RepID=A0A4Z2HXQ4_9TELE|nr:hypothetical protein EYF80_020076 [Liparis tanakae]